MRRRPWACIVFASLSAACSIPAGTILDETFQDLHRFTDLSRLITWGGHAKGTSAFQLKTDGGRRAVCLTADAMSHSGYSSETDLRTFTALDHVFASPVEARKETLTVTFDARWDNAAAGEGGRFMVIAMDSYPSAGVKGEDISNFTGDPYGTPGLHVRMRPGMTSFLQYGGGHGGEFEKYATQWWLPGFIQNALCSCCPSCSDANCCKGSPGTGNQWPNGSWLATSANICHDTWTTYTYRLMPHKQQILEGSTERAAMVFADVGSAPDFELYERFYGLRLYWRGNHNVYIANLKVTRSAGNVVTPGRGGLRHDRTVAPLLAVSLVREGNSRGLAGSDWFDLHGRMRLTAAPGSGILLTRKRI